LSAKQGNYWYHFITSLVWRGPWLGIEPGTSRTLPLGYRGGGTALTSHFGHFLM